MKAVAKIDNVKKKFANSTELADWLDTISAAIRADKVSGFDLKTDDRKKIVRGKFFISFPTDLNVVYDDEEEEPNNSGGGGGGAE